MSRKSFYVIFISLIALAAAPMAFAQTASGTLIPTVTVNCSVSLTIATAGGIAASNGGPIDFGTTSYYGHAVNAGGTFYNNSDAAAYFTVYTPVGVTAGSSNCTSLGVTATHNGGAANWGTPGTTYSMILADSVANAQAAPTAGTNLVPAAGSLTITSFPSTMYLGISVPKTHAAGTASATVTFTATGS